MTLRRNLLRRLTGLAGAVGLAGCFGRSEQGTVGPSADLPPNPRGDELPRRQHAWNERLAAREDGNRLLPRHFRILLLTLDGEPTEEDAATVERAIRTLEAAFDYGPEGLLHMLGWGSDYFERLDRLEASPVRHPQVLSRTDDPDLLSFDAALVLASDDPSHLNAVESAMFDSDSELAGETVEERLGDVLSIRTRRTGFTGDGLPADHADTDGVPSEIPSDVPNFMGVFSNVRGAQASEDRVTIEDGPYEGGTTMHLSHLRQSLDAWWGMDESERTERMFSPEFTPADVDALETDLPFTDNVTDHARDEGVVGHWEKVARVREDGEPLLLRRDFNTVDSGHAGVHFLSLQKDLEDFVTTRDAMNGWWLREEHESPGTVNDRENNGILDFVEVLSRANFYVPPRAERAFP
ncbi:hypothetical protein ACFOZ7_08300 [Natribaculum luteum]|uniref:Tat pathway signal protein n=1 Tax=Natribaculum luteum TaxID=1586232 RepID=A0ABD5NZ84_9EURY|nr:Tat pathway signal protein [Natribaculum luteum]